MKIGDLVRSVVSLTEECQSGVIIKLIIGDAFGEQGAMILWDHGEICYSPLGELDELEVINEISESR